MTLIGNGLFACAVSGQCVENNGFFLVVEPLCLLGFVHQIEVGHHTHYGSRKTFQDEHPLPVFHSHDVDEMREYPAGQGTADDSRRGDGQQEARGDASTPGTWIPIGQIKNDSRPEASFGSAQQGAGNVELSGRCHERHGRRDQAPQHHDPGDRQPGTNLLQVKRAGYFQCDVADEKQAYAEPVGSIAHA
ncbi:hypothetical protein D3C76_1073260 [compost metagenome]